MGTLHEVPIVTAAVAYDDPITSQVYILFFHQSLLIKSLQHHLICPQQLRHNQVTVNEVPLLHLPYDQRYHDSHSIITPEVTIPLLLDGVISHFNVRKPTAHEVNSPDHFTHVHLTSSSPWNPQDPQNATLESSLRAALDSDQPGERGRNRRIQSVQAILNTRTSAAVDMNQVGAALHHISVATTKPPTRKGAVTADVLAKRWNIGLEAAKKTIANTTQRAVRDFTHTSGGRRMKPLAYQLRYPRLNVEMYTDTVFGKVKSLLGNTCAQVYTTPFHWCHVDPMRTKSEAHLTLDALFKSVGIPRVLIPDNAKELTQGDFRRKAQRVQCPIHPVEAYTPNQNFAEDAIRELKRSLRRTMSTTESLECLWDLCLVYLSMVRSHTALPIRELQGQVPATLLTGDTADISHICEFGWYDWVWYISPEKAGETMERKRLGRYCGPSSDIGDAICARILTDKGRLVSRTSVIPLSQQEKQSPVIESKKKAFTESLQKALGKRYTIASSDDRESREDLEPEFYEPIDDRDPAPLPELSEADDIQHEAYDKYISARVCVKQGDNMAYGTVTRRKRDGDGNLIGGSNTNPWLDTSVYEVDFDSGETEAFTANIIAEAIYSRLDDEGYTIYELADILDHAKDGHAVSGDDAYIYRNGRKSLRRTTKGWKLQCQWKDGTTSWIPLKDMKEGYPLQTAEYAQQNQLLQEPAFSWWVPHTLKTRNRILSAAKTRYARKEQKYGIDLPKTVEEALAIDKATGTTFWHDAIKKEMKAVGKAFEILDEGAPAPVGHTFIKCHMIFDVKSDFSRKARLVAGGHMTDPPSSITYASVVSRESVRLAFLIAALNDLDILAADIGNAYLNAPVREKIYITCGKEFGPFEGRKAKIVRALYGLKSSGAAWRSHLAEVLRDNLGFTSCKADNDVWYRAATKSDGTRYYEYILVYTDDILCLSTDPNTLLCYLDQHFLLKPGSLGKPTQYLGASVKEFNLPGATKPCWSMGSEQYVKEAVRNVESWLEKRGKALKSKVSSVLPCNYTPELDVSDLCNDELHNYFQQQIGVLRWAVELGRIDICTEVSIMASYCAAPRVGHLDAVFHMIAYLKQHSRSHIVFDPAYVKHQEPQRPDWRDFYADAREMLPPDMPEPLGEPVQITAFVDSDHAGDKVTRRSRTGVLVFANMSPIVWHSKKQGSIETSSFGSEFAAMKVGFEIVEGLRYKLRMMGVPLDGPAHIKADNMSVIKNSTIPESTLKKKSNSIAYHYVRERVAAGVANITYENTDTNLADMLTKIQSGPVRQRLVSKVLY